MASKKFLDKVEEHENGYTDGLNEKIPSDEMIIKITKLYDRAKEYQKHRLRVALEYDPELYDSNFIFNFIKEHLYNK